MGNNILQQYCPEQINIKPKQTLQNLYDIVKSYNLYRIEDYETIIYKLNEIIDFYNILFDYNQIYLSSFFSSPSTFISSLIIQNCPHVTTFNGKYGKDLNCEVTSSVFFKNKKYSYSLFNKGNINLGENFIQGRDDNYVHTFNNTSGKVYGIQGVILNNEIYQATNKNEGKIEISGLSEKIKDPYVKTLNNSLGNIDNILCSVIIDSKNTKQIANEKEITRNVNLIPIITGIINVDKFISYNNENKELHFNTPLDNTSTYINELYESTGNQPVTIGYIKNDFSNILMGSFESYKNIENQEIIITKPNYIIFHILHCYQNNYSIDNHIISVFYNMDGSCKIKFDDDISSSNPITIYFLYKK